MEDKIFDAYLKDRCPVCGAKKSEQPYSETKRNGKAVSLEFHCESCLAIYKVGLKNTEQSEIIVNPQRKGEQE